MRKKTGKNKTLVMIASILIVTLFIGTSMSSVVARPKAIPVADAANSWTDAKAAEEAEKKAAAEEEAKAEQEVAVEEESQEEAVQEQADVAAEEVPQEEAVQEQTDAEVAEETIQEVTIEQQAESVFVEDIISEYINNVGEEIPDDSIFKDAKSDSIQDCPECALANEALKEDYLKKVEADLDYLTADLKASDAQDFIALFEMMPDIMQSINQLSSAQLQAINFYYAGYMAGVADANSDSLSNNILKQEFTDLSGIFKQFQLNGVNDLINPSALTANNQFSQLGLSNSGSSMNPIIGEPIMAGGMVQVGGSIRLPQGDNVALPNGPSECTLPCKEFLQEYREGHPNVDDFLNQIETYFEEEEYPWLQIGGNVLGGGVQIGQAFWENDMEILGVAAAIAYYAALINAGIIIGSGIANIPNWLKNRYIGQGLGGAPKINGGKILTDGAMLELLKKLCDELCGGGGLFNSAAASAASASAATATASATATATSTTATSTTTTQLNMNTLLINNETPYGNAPLLLV